MWIAPANHALADHAKAWFVLMFAREAVIFNPLWNLIKDQGKPMEIVLIVNMEIPELVIQEM
jgi:hypothetical protein